ncbi:MAG: DNA repair protein RecN [Oscillospiraceae bacterium]|nr:DNA repair protein RecN [Oscillospiraceae bacterium]
MLEELYIENLAVIEKACIRFQKAFHVFTGETGAGKSILIHGIQAVLGQRVSRDWVRTGCERASITALFTDLSEPVMQMLTDRGISCEEGQITLTREIRADGGSIGRINGKTASVSALKEIGLLLISIHGQHDNQILLNPENHLHVLDEFGGNPEFLKAYQTAFHELQNVAKELGRCKKKEQARREKSAVLQKQIQEIGALHLKPDEEEELENALIQAENSERIISALAGSAGLLGLDNEDSASERVRSALLLLQEIEDVYSDTGEIAGRLQTCLIELKDIAQDLQGMSESISLDENQLQKMQQRYQAISQAKKQFFCDFDELIRIYENAQQEMQNMQEDTEKIAELEQKKNLLLADVTEKANALSEYRTESGKKFAGRVAEELKFLDMPDVVLTVRQEKGKLTIQGRDSVSFLISANKGEEPKPISKIASGGELSRIMLALKSVIADRDQIPTLIFDEIDTGVSGRAAQKIGIKLREISRQRQVLCVTHLSQIAVMADTQYMIEKHQEQDRTVTQVHVLDFEGRVQEIARIMGGENPSELMLENAREELKKISQESEKHGNA